MCSKEQPRGSRKMKGKTQVIAMSLQIQHYRPTYAEPRKRETVSVFIVKFDYTVCIKDIFLIKILKILSQEGSNEGGLYISFCLKTENKE